jgi:hypothetical protein
MTLVSSQYLDLPQSCISPRDANQQVSSPCYRSPSSLCLCGTLGEEKLCFSACRSLLHLNKTCLICLCFAFFFFLVSDFRITQPITGKVVLKITSVLSFHRRIQARCKDLVKVTVNLLGEEYTFNRLKVGCF